MLKMKLPMQTAEEGVHTVEDTQENTDSSGHTSVPYSGVNHRFKYSTSESCNLSQIGKEVVFEWFGRHLSPSKRIEFMYGLLHMCHPLELRFLGSCLEDLARKDVHVLDSEIRANSQSDLGLLMDVADPVVRSKLLVCLSLLGSENRECAGTLYRALSHMDPTLYLNSCYDVPLSPRGTTQNVPDQNSTPEWGVEAQRFGHPSGSTLELESGSLEHLALLLTMASLHPAFSFHQRSTVRHHLDNVERAIEGKMHCHNRTSVQHYGLWREEPSPNKTDLGASAHCVSNHLPNRTSFQREAFHIDKIVLKRISWNQGNREYCIEVQWSDSTWSTVTKTHHELDDFLSKLLCKRSSDPFERGLLKLLAQGAQYEPRELERALQERLLSAPEAFRQRGEVCRFLLPDCGVCKGLCPGLSLQGDNPVPSAKTRRATMEHFKDDCTEPSSQEEDLAGQFPGHQTSSSSQGQRTLIPKSSQRDIQRPAVTPEHNGVKERRNKVGTVSCRPGRHQNEEEKRAFAPEQKSRRRPDERWRSEGAKVYIPNESVQDRSGDTWSEASRTRSSPQHEPRERLDGEDLEDLEEERDTNGSFTGQSIHGKRPRGHRRVKAVATVHPMVPVVYQEESSSTWPGPQHLASVVQNGLVPDRLQPADASLADRVLTGTARMVPRESIPSQTSLGDPVGERRVSPPTDPGSSGHLVPQRFRTPTSLESRSSNPQHPMGAITVIPSTSHMPPLQPARTGPDPASATLPLSAYTPDPGPRPPTLASLPASATPSSAAAVTAPADSPVAGPAQTFPHSTVQGDAPGAEVGQARPQPKPPSHPQQQMGCDTCGCRDGCGGSHSASPGFYFPPQVGHQVFSNAHLPLFHVPSMSGAGYPGRVQHQGNGAGQLPFYPPRTASATPLQYVSGPLLRAAHPDRVLVSQAGYNLPQMAPFNRFYAPVYTSMGVGLGAGVKKSSANVSCYNCGLGGHYALDCKQPSVEAGHQGGFQLKYTAPHSSEGLDKSE
ncbi:zinc finger CCHC domain-containing protein 2 isoform X2 [Esox lucius]|uniref:zinc finger CCHC domain-containing protein 2 isoform X2 n=1 Tax=Esox lucius TaxID=8010 RepID=UPI001476E0F3|nr:zinc finger CCHC domain-containing protein 2 isoform X2 [Esox lucius]